MQVCGTAGVLEWTDFCIPWTEDKCEYTVKDAGMFVDLYTKVGQKVETKQVSSWPLRYAVLPVRCFAQLHLYCKLDI